MIINGAIRPRPVTVRFWIDHRGESRSPAVPTAAVRHCRGVDVALRILLLGNRECGNYASRHAPPAMPNKEWADILHKGEGDAVII